MINAVAGEPFLAKLSDYDPGIAAQLTIEVYDPATDPATTILAASGTGITEPRAGTYKATRTVPTAGTYLLRWSRPTATDPYDLVVAEEDLVVRAMALLEPGVGITPSLDEIGTINRSRTVPVGLGSTPSGTFNDNTRPTGDEVSLLAVIAANQVADQLGNDIPDAFTDRARDIAALYAAALVESSTDDPRNAQIDQWTKLADARVKALADRIAEVAAGGLEGASDDLASPVFSFPCADPLPPGA